MKGISKGICEVRLDSQTLLVTCLGGGGRRPVSFVERLLSIQAARSWKCKHRFVTLCL